MKFTTYVWCALLSLGTMACGDDDPIVETRVVTDTGKQIAMDGVWQSECIDFTDYRLKEQFSFDGQNLVISIDQFSAQTCENADATESVTIEFEVLGTLEVEFNGATVVANKISGTERSSKDDQTSSFKQTFYIVDNDGQYTLYHGVFADDGGSLSDDGFPVELHPFPIRQL